MHIKPYPGNRQITENFWLHEASVSRSYPHLVEPVPEHLVKNVEKLFTRILQPLRSYLGTAILITSLYRSPALNSAVGGSPTSQHRFAEAADCAPADPRRLFLVLLNRELDLPVGQVIYYPNQRFVHIALPSSKYPSPAFSVPRNDGRLIPVKSEKDLRALGV